MGKKISQASAEKWIADNCPQYKMLEWAGNCEKASKFINVETRKQFRYSFSQFKLYVKRGRKLGTLVTSKQEAVDFLKEVAPHIQLIEWAGKAAAVSKFRDCKRDLDFEYDFRTLKGELKRNPSYVPRMSVEEKTKLSLENGPQIYIEGKSIRAHSEELGICKSLAYRLYKQYGEDAILNYKTAQNNLETKLFDYLKAIENDVVPNSRVWKKYVPDFLIESKKLIIECDGLYWHSESVQRRAKKSSSYHQKKKRFYEEEGYKSLFFREDEIHHKFDIVCSIINNKLGLSERIHARKCEVRKVNDPDLVKAFINANHLMGASGSRDRKRSYGLYYNNILVCIMEVKTRKKKERVLEISRFCPRLNASIVGGFSKLIKAVIDSEQPNQIVTFIDRRYGDGEYLSGMGWKKIHERISFQWTNYTETVHRMKFPGKSGLEKGWDRIYDCGQAKWVLERNR